MLNANFGRPESQEGFGFEAESNWQDYQDYLDARGEDNVFGEEDFGFFDDEPESGPDDFSRFEDDDFSESDDPTNGWGDEFAEFGMDE